MQEGNQVKRNEEPKQNKERERKKGGKELELCNKIHYASLSLSPAQHP